MVGIIVMLFTLPQMIGLEFTIAMAMTMSVLMGIYVILVTEVIHRTALAMVGALIIIIILIYTGLIPAHDSVDFVIGSIDFNTIGLLLVVQLCKNYLCISDIIIRSTDKANCFHVSLCLQDLSD